MEKCGINGSLKSFFYTGYCDTPTNEEVCRSERCESPAIPRCEERSFEDFTQADFIRNFLSVSKPVVIKGAAQRLSYFTQWTKEFLKLKFGQKELHIKLAPRANGTVGEFEGVEHISRWNLGKFAVPDIIRSHLENPELVMVRPASVDMRLEDFFQQIDNPDHLGHNVSAYLEYTSIKDLLGGKDF